VTATPARTGFRPSIRGLTSNPGYKLLSLGIALVAWLWVQGSQVIPARVRAQVVWTSPTGLMAVEALPASVTLTVVGPRHATRMAAQGEVRIPIDLSKSDQGPVSLDLSTFAIDGLPANLTVTDIEPSTLKFTLDSILAKKVRVEARTIGDPAEGWQVAAVDVDPQVVSIRGPRAVVSSVSTVATLPVDVSDFVEDAEQRVDLDLPRNTELVTDDPIRVSVDVEPRFVTLDLEAVPVQVWEGDGWTVDPATVRVVLQGPSEELSRIGDDDVVAFVHLPAEPTRKSYDPAYGPTSGTRLRVLHPGGDEVTVEAVTPARVKVTRP